MNLYVDRETLKSNYVVLFLNLTLGTSPMILHTNMKTVERWPDLYSFSVFSNIMSTLSFPFIFLCCSTYRRIVYLWNATVNKLSASVVNFSVPCPSLDVKITSSLSQRALAHTRTTHRQHLFIKMVLL